MRIRTKCCSLVGNTSAGSGNDDFGITKFNIPTTKYAQFCVFLISNKGKAFV